MKKFDCAIVGAGMVGAASAVALANLGLSVVLIDQQAPLEFSESQPFDLRVSAISLGSQHFLEQLRAWQQVVDWRSCPYQRLAVWENDSAYTEFSAKSIGQSHLGHIVENRLLQLSLWQQVKRQNNIDLLCPESIVSFEQSEDGVTLALAQSQVTAKLLLACDGANSQIRKLVNIGLTGWDYQQSAMLINVETELGQQDITWQKYYPTGPVAMLPMPGNNASLVWYHQRAYIKELSLLSNEQLQSKIMSVFPETLGNIKVLSKGSFPLTRRHANNYYRGRVVLLGDAAHTINPMAGQGVNLGFKDVIALQKVIAEAIADNQPWYLDSVLKSYERSRRYDNLLMMSGMDVLYRSFSHPSPLIKGLRNLALKATNTIPSVKKQVLKYACGIN